IFSGNEVVTVAIGSVLFDSAHVNLLSGSTLTGPGAANITKIFTWSDAAMSGTGTTNLGSSTLTTTTTNLTGNDTIDARALNNFGTVSDSVTLTLLNGATINNKSGATW